MCFHRQTVSLFFGSICLWMKTIEEEQIFAMMELEAEAKEEEKDFLHLFDVIEERIVFFSHVTFSLSAN